MSKRSLSGRGRRRKGHDWQRDIARRWAEGLWPEAQRGLQDRSGFRAADVEGTPYYVEAKADESVSVWTAMAQADEANEACNAIGGPRRLAVVIAKRNRQPPIAVMRLCDWEDRERRIQHLEAQLAAGQQVAIMAAKAIRGASTAPANLSVTAPYVRVAGERENGSEGYG